MRTFTSAVLAGLASAEVLS
jgi:C1A family cysteine protease